MMQMSHRDFVTLLSNIEADITPKQVLGGHKVISATDRLTLTIRFLATGQMYRSLSYQFRISVAAISYIVQEVCDAIVRNIGKTFLKVPLSMEEWITIADSFEET